MEHPTIKELKKHLKKVSKRILSAIDKSKVQALNRTVTSAKGELARLVKDDLGVKLKLTRARIRTKKATAANLRGNVEFAVKQGISLSEFKARRKKSVKTTRGKREGVTAQLPGQGRQVVPGAVLRTVKNGRTIVMARTKSYVNGSYINKKADRTPTVALKASPDFIKKSIVKVYPKLREHVNERLRTEIKASMSHNIGKLK